MGVPQGQRLLRCSMCWTVLKPEKTVLIYHSTMRPLQPSGLLASLLLRIFDHDHGFLLRLWLGDSVCTCWWLLPRDTVTFWTHHNPHQDSDHYHHHRPQPLCLPPSSPNSISCAKSPNSSFLIFRQCPKPPPPPRPTTTTITTASDTPASTITIATNPPSLSHLHQFFLASAHDQRIPRLLDRDHYVLPFDHLHRDHDHHHICALPLPRLSECSSPISLPPLPTATTAPCLLWQPTPPATRSGFPSAWSRPLCTPPFG